MGASFALFGAWSLAYEGVLLLNSADGLTYQQITDHLGITLRTVKFHVKNVYSKVGVSNRHEFCQLGTVPNWHNWQIGSETPVRSVEQTGVLWVIG